MLYSKVVILIGSYSADIDKYSDIYLKYILCDDFCVG